MSEYDIELYKVLGDMIRQERIEKGLTLKQVADQLGVTTKTIQRYELGERKIKVNTLMELTDLFGLDNQAFLRRAKGRVADAVPGNQSTGNYYLDDEVADMAQEIYDNPELKILFDASRKVSKEDLQLVVDMVTRLKDSSAGSEEQ